jgi:hypothetical protein
MPSPTVPATDDDIAHDHQLRALLKAHLAQRTSAAASLVVDELEVAYGAARADVAVIGERLEGFEIKAGNDTMVRLSRQVQAYDRVFERSWAVTVQAHLAKVEALLPSWWGLLVVEPGSALCVHREARDNPMVEAVSAAKFLWRDEAFALLEKHGLSKGMKSKPKLALFAKLADNVPLAVLLADVRAALKARTNWRDEHGSSVLAKKS